MKKKMRIGVTIVAIMFVSFFVLSRLMPMATKSDEFPKNAIAADIKEVTVETLTTSVNKNGTVDFVDKTTIYPSTQAELEFFDLKVGDTVTEGQVIALYSQDALDNLNDQLKDANLVLRTAMLSLQNVTLPATETELLQAQSSIEQSEKSISDINAQILQSDISLETIERELKVAEDNYINNKALYDGGAITKTALDSFYDVVAKIEDQLRTARSQRNTLNNSMQTAQSALTLSQKQYNAVANKTNQEQVVVQSDQQRVQIDQANRSIEKIQKEIDKFKTQDVATASGTVISAGYTVGETSSIAKPLCVIADISNKNMIITVFIPENDASEIEVGQKAQIKGDSIGDNVYAGTVSRIYPIAEKKQIGNNMETAITIEVTIDEPNAQIKPGFTVEVDVETKVIIDAVVAPLMSTMLETDGSYYVFVVKDDNTVEKRPIKLLTYSDLSVEVEGVKAGERVIENPSDAIKEGLLVRQSEPDETDKAVSPMGAMMGN